MIHSQINHTKVWSFLILLTILLISGCSKFDLYDVNLDKVELIEGEEINFRFIIRDLTNFYTSKNSENLDLEQKCFTIYYDDKKLSALKISTLDYELDVKHDEGILSLCPSFRDYIAYKILFKAKNITEYQDVTKISIKLTRFDGKIIDEKFSDFILIKKSPEEVKPNSSHK